MTKQTKLNVIPLHPTANVAGVVATLRHTGFTAYCETDRSREVLFTDATNAQAILAFGHSNWIDRRSLSDVDRGELETLPPYDC